jgi:protoporphyrinogen oxidase
MTKVVILGAGLTGLSSAIHLEEKNFYDYKVFEKEDIPGGLCRSISDNGFTYDFTGHLLHLKTDYGKNFVETLTKNSSLDEKFNLIPRRSFIYSNNTYTNYPFQTNLFGLPTSTISQCIEGYLKRKTYIKKPKNFYEWVLKYFGSGIGKHFLFPYNTKLYSFNPKKLLHSWTGRFVPQTNLKSMLDGALKESSQKIGYNSMFYYPKTGGINYLPNQMSKKIKNTIHTKYVAEKIDLKNKTILFENGHEEKFEILINTIPLNKLLSITKTKSNTSFSQAKNKLICSSVLNFNIGVNVENVSQKHWMYFPEKKYTFYRIGFWNNFSKSLVAKNCSAIYGEFSYHKNQTTTKQVNNLVQKAKKQFLDHFGLNKNNIVNEKTLDIHHAYAIYDSWREKNLKKLHTTLQSESIFSIGRYGEWKYSSMEDAILDGQKTAFKILEQI